MDAHVFRRCCDMLVPLLTGARLEKIQSPAVGVHMFTVFTHGRKQYVYLRSGRQQPFLFISPNKTTANAQPSAGVMRLRKYVGGRRIISCSPDWVGRRLSLLCGTVQEGTHKGEECWLVLDLRDGPFLWMGQSAFAPSCPVIPGEICWPEPQNLEEACTQWQKWPVLTPALRRTLPYLDSLDRQALLADLEYGGGDIFCYSAPNGPTELVAWPLPKAQCKERKEVVREDVLTAVAEVAGQQVLGEVTRATRAGAVSLLEKERRRLSRILEKQLAEEARLQAMCAAQDEALLLQSVLWRCSQSMRAALLDIPLDKEAGKEEPHVAPMDADGKALPVASGWYRLKLDPRLSLRENMEALFHKAKRGKRGLVFVAERRLVIQQELQAVHDAIQRAQMGLMPVLQAHKAAAPERGAALASNLPKGVQAFVSSDGFAIMRGRDVKGNLMVLRLASPHDIWLHVEGGPGSHAIIRRSFAGQEVPEKTLLEAGALVACKSWQRDNDRAAVLYAEARHVKPMRNAAMGMVRIDKVFMTRVVWADLEVEKRLALPT